MGMFFLPIFERLIQPNTNIYKTYERLLRKKLDSTPIGIYIGQNIGYSLLLSLFTGLVVFALYFISLTTPPLITGTSPVIKLLGILKSPFIFIPLGTILSIIISLVLVFGAQLIQLQLEVDARKREINILLPEALAFMYSLSVGGLNQIEVLEAVAVSEDTYGEVSVEFQSILRSSNYFDTDYKTAISEQAEVTPSKSFSLFLSDMLSILSSGGDIESFLEEQKRKFNKSAKQEQEDTLETLELFGEMYTPLSLFPLLLIIVLVIMGLMGESQPLYLYAVVYGLIPLLNIGFLVIIGTVKKDTIGSGELSFEEIQEVTDDISAEDLSKDVKDEQGLLDIVSYKEKVFNLQNILRYPHRYFKSNPTHSLLITVPIALLSIIIFFIRGYIPLSIDEFKMIPIVGTLAVFYIPSYIIFIPLMFFHEWSQYSKNQVTNHMSDTLRKLANANDTGQNLYQALSIVSENSDTKLSQELDVVYSKVEYGTSLQEALIEFNNKYKIPRLSRLIKLITTSSRVSNELTDVLTTAAETSERQDDIERERKSRARMQVAIILMTYMTLLAVMAILQTQLIDVMTGLVEQASGGGGGGGGAAPGGQFQIDLDPELLSLIFFHAVTIQGVLSGFISGYIRSASILSGLKYVLVVQTISLFVWGVFV